MEVARKTKTYDGTAGAGAEGTVSLFNVTGEVLVHNLTAFCTSSLAAGVACEINLAVTNSVELFILDTLGTNIDGDEFWVSTTPTGNGIALPAALKEIVIEENIINVIKTGDVTSGTIAYTCYWDAISTDGNVAAA